MRKTHAPSQGANKVNNIKSDTKPFPGAARSTEQLLSILSKCANLDESMTENLSDTSSTSFTCHELPIINTYADVTKSISFNNNQIHRVQYNVVWSKQTKKKHKTWEGDGILEVDNNFAVLKDMNGVILGRSSKKKVKLEEGSHTFVGSKEIEIINEITKKENRKENVFSNKNLGVLEIKDTWKSSETNKSLFRNPRKKLQLDIGLNSPLQHKNENLLIMPRPDYVHQLKYNSANATINDVTLDYFLTRALRRHQQEGVAFLYSCVTGIRNIKYNGAILADEMGLGKTLQCISLIWILLKSSPYGGLQMVQRVLIVTPSSLVTNWLKEFKKWIGFQRLKPFVISQKQKLCDFANSPASQQPVLILSYEMLIRHIKDLKQCKFQLLICDEGHRLKNSQIRVTQFLSELNIKCRIILTGTPIQNNLQEFYALVNFVNPEILGTYLEFKKYYEVPIVDSNQPTCSDESKKLGEERANELNHRTNTFILRRTQSVIGQYLPSKQECVIFCLPSQLQIKLYEATISLWEDSIIEGATKISHLSIITILRKICNDPRLLQFNVTETGGDDDEYFDIDSLQGDLFNRLQCIIQSHELCDTKFSGKISVIEGFLRELSQTKERIVLISYFTQTLDLLQQLCMEQNYNFLRLDGSTSTSVRSESVDKFNAVDSKYFIFLLSAKAGGVGLNLTGASRLILFDLDWNPASDLQAMSRIWRDGQKKKVYIYRFLTTGSIEEKIYQRQISKTFLSDAVVNSSSKLCSPLSFDELKDLFTFKLDCYSLTHELLCECDGNGIPETTLDDSDTEERLCQLSVINQTSKNKSILRISELTEWEHYIHPVSKDVLEELYLKFSSDLISFVFRNKTLN